MSIKTTNYALTEPFSYQEGRYDTKTLPAGAFVRPIELVYVPKHVIEDSRWSSFNKKTDVFCYCRWGVIPIPRNLLRET